MGAASTDALTSVDALWCAQDRNQKPETRKVRMPSSATPTTRLGELMEQRGLQLGLRWEDVAAKSRISTTFLRKIRKGAAGMSGHVAAALEDTLQWERGSIAAIQAGRDPVPLADSEARMANMTLGELLIARGLAKPAELGASDDIRHDPIALEILEMDTSEATKNNMLRIYASMRRQMFEEIRGSNRRARGEA